MIEKEFNDRIYTKSTAKREKYTIHIHVTEHRIISVTRLPTHVRIQKKASGTSSSPEASIKTAATYSPTVTQYHRRDKA